MPKLKQIQCSIKMGSLAPALPEYGVRYSDGHVETFVPVPDTDVPFWIHIQTQGYIAPGLAVFVFIDGEYHCNRNRVNLKLPGDGIIPEDYEVEFRLRQKEEKTVSGHFVTRDWTFARLNKVNYEDAQTVNPRFIDNLGTIEIVVLRCRSPLDGVERHCKPGPGKKEYAPARLGKTAAVKVPQAKKAHSVPPKKPPKPAQSENGDLFGGLFGLFDGANDYPLSNGAARPLSSRKEPCVMTEPLPGVTGNRKYGGSEPFKSTVARVEEAGSPEKNPLDISGPGVINDRFGKHNDVASGNRGPQLDGCFAPRASSHRQRRSLRLDDLRESNIFGAGDATKPHLKQSYGSYLVSDFSSTALAKLRRDNDFQGRPPSMCRNRQTTPTKRVHMRSQSHATAISRSAVGQTLGDSDQALQDISLLKEVVDELQHLGSDYDWDQVRRALRVDEKEIRRKPSVRYETPSDELAVQKAQHKQMMKDLDRIETFCELSEEVAPGYNCFPITRRMDELRRLIDTYNTLIERTEKLGRMVGQRNQILNQQAQVEDDCLLRPWPLAHLQKLHQGDLPGTTNDVEVMAEVLQAWEGENSTFRLDDVWKHLFEYQKQAIFFPDKPLPGKSAWGLEGGDPDDPKQWAEQIELLIRRQKYMETFETRLRNLRPGFTSPLINKRCKELTAEGLELHRRRQQALSKRTLQPSLGKEAGTHTGHTLDQTGTKTERAQPGWEEVGHGSFKDGVWATQGNKNKPDRPCGAAENAMIDSHNQDLNTRNSNARERDLNKGEWEVVVGNDQNVPGVTSHKIGDNRASTETNGWGVQPSDWQENDQDWGRAVPSMSETTHDGCGEAARSIKCSGSEIKPRKSDRNDCNVEIKGYWEDWNDPDERNPHPNDLSRLPPREVYRYPATPLPAVPANKLKDRSHGIQTSRGVDASHFCSKPIYIDTMAAPYAVFSFKYRSASTLKSRFKLKIDDGDVKKVKDEVEREKYMLMPKDQLVEQMMMQNARPRKRAEKGCEKEKDNGTKNDGVWPSASGGELHQSARSSHSRSSNGGIPRASTVGKGHAGADDWELAIEKIKGGGGSGWASPAKASSKAGSSKTHNHFDGKGLPATSGFIPDQGNVGQGGGFW